MVIKGKRLHRSKKERMVAGICGGLGEYFGIDPTIVRLIVAALSFSGVGIAFYFLGWIIIPEESLEENVQVQNKVSQEKTE